MDVLSQKCTHTWISVQWSDTRANNSKFPLEYSNAKQKVLRAKNLPIFHDTHQAFHSANVFTALQVLHFPLLCASEWLLQKISPACSDFLLSKKQPGDIDCGWAARRRRRQKAQQLSAGTVPSKDAGRQKPLLSRLRQIPWRTEVASATSCLSHCTSEHRHCPSGFPTGQTDQAGAVKALTSVPKPSLTSHPSTSPMTLSPSFQSILHFTPWLTLSPTSFNI